jgi:hypothetical protein
MAQAKPLPDRDWLLENLRYEPETGLLWWKTPRQGRLISRPAGGQRYNSSDGTPSYVSIVIDGRSYLAHRIIWLMVTGMDPGSLGTYHVDNNPFNNAFSNLQVGGDSVRLASRKSYGTSKHKGVYFFKRTGRWQASKWENGKHKHLGYFDTEEEAAAAAAPYYIH